MMVQLNTDLPINDHEKEELALIPIRFLFRTPRIIKLNPSFITLRDTRPEDIITLLDLFTVDLFKRKPIRNVRDYVYENKDRLIKAYHYYSKVPVIPSDVSFDDPIGLMVKLFVSEYIDRMRMRNSLLIPEESEKRNKRIELFESAYDDRVIAPFSKELSAKKYGITPERVRQLLIGNGNTIGAKLCQSVIRGEIEVDDFRINHIFQSRFEDLAFSNKCAYSYSSFSHDNELFDEKTCRFLLDTLDLTICESNIYFETLIIKGDNITALNHNAAILMKYFTDSAVFVSLVDDVAPFLQDKLHNNTELVNIMLDIVRCSNRFEPIEDNDNDKYALKWQYLQTIPSRIIRIIYDSGGPLTTASIIEEYNKRALVYGIEPIIDEEVTMRRAHSFLASSGKPGYWSIKSTSEEVRTPSIKVRDAIDTFLREHDGKAYLHDIIKHLSSIGLYYPERSIRTYLSSMCYAVRNHANLFVHNDFLDQYPLYIYVSKNNNKAQTVLPIVISYLAKHGRKASLKSLVEDYANHTGKRLRDTTLRTMVAQYPTITTINKINGWEIEVELMVSEEEALKLLEEHSINKRPPYYRTILLKAREIISLSPHGFISVKSLYDELVQYVPDNKKKNIIYKLLRNSPEFETYIVDKKLFIRLSNNTI